LELPVEVPVPAIAEVAVYLLYSVLAFAEVLALFAVAIVLFIFLLKQAVKVLGAWIDAVIAAWSREAEPRLGNPKPLGVNATKRVRQIPGGHNERF
jgi:hypothetical protein